MTQVAETRSKPLILVADDDATIRVIMREVLEQVGYCVIEADDGCKALEIYKSDSPDVIMLDVEMPGMSGFAVCEAVRAHETGRQTPIFIVTGHDDAESVEKAYHLGATDFISKPIAWPVVGHRVKYVQRANNALNDLKRLILAVPDLVLLLDNSGVIMDRLSAVDADSLEGAGELMGKRFEQVFPHEQSERVRKCIEQAIATGQPQVHEHEYQNGDHHFETRFVARDKYAVLAIVRDITERKETESRIYDLAFYDRLTGLPNRELFGKHLEESIRSAKESSGQFAILFIDLDRFKRINDTLGHSTGDSLLQSVARRLEKCTRTKDYVGRVDQQAHKDIRLARLGGDEFVLVLHEIESESAASVVASRIVSELNRPFNCDGHQFVISPSIGIAIYPDDGSNGEELLMNADSAMYRAKATGRNNYKFYSETMRTKSLRRLDLETELRRAINEEHFMLHYQPKVDAESWTVIGAEALIRWQHAERGWISPAEFIPVAEESGLIVSLGQWVLEQSCAQLAKWQNTGLLNIGLSVNISSQQVHTDDFVKSVEHAISSSGIDPARLELEITESLLMRDVESTIASLSALKDLGLEISVDDFGTGYSSLSYLKRFPINSLKIDRSFVQDLHLDNDDAAICAAIIAMAHKLGLSVVAEGVELEEQLDFLLRHGCRQIQGFLFSKPLPADELEALASKHQGAVDKVAS